MICGTMKVLLGVLQRLQKTRFYYSIIFYVGLEDFIPSLKTTALHKVKEKGKKGKRKEEGRKIEKGKKD